MSQLDIRSFQSSHVHFVLCNIIVCNPFTPNVKYEIGSKSTSNLSDDTILMLCLPSRNEQHHTEVCMG